jgi:hypothetical protein
MGRHSSHLVPKRTGPNDEILNKLWPHNHLVYVWLTRHLLDNIHICNKLTGLFASIIHDYGNCNNMSNSRSNFLVTYKILM